MPRQAQRGAAWLRRGSSRRPWGWPGTCRSAPFVSYRRDSAEIVTCVLCRGQGEALTQVCRRVVERGRGGGGGGRLRGRTRCCRRGRAAQPGGGTAMPTSLPVEIVARVGALGAALLQCVRAQRGRRSRSRNAPCWP